MFGKSPFVQAIKAAANEAQRRGDRRIGTEHLLLGLLHDPHPALAEEVDLATARAALADLDSAALQAIGLDIGQAPQARPPKHPPVPGTALTTSARATINHAIKATTRKNRSADGPARLLHALLTQRWPNPVAQLIDQLGVDRVAVQARIDAAH
ncbi:Clp protease N-terminal domain-containing protein [Nonomuraea sp. NPDC050394]|uniref:Clp protease N-terminal domain-containing protein n=1 Tax=Nonomuraea sp. NPDC050394 TaxID=3364363 RepID=UPI0037B739BD